MDGVLCDYAGRAREIGVTLDDAQYIKGFFGKLEPIPGAIDAFNKLAEDFEVYILSCACWRNPSSFSDKVLWINKYLPAGIKRLILTHHKDLCVGDYLIDDRPHHGTDKFNGEWIKFGSEKFPDWNSVLDYIYKQNTKEV